MTVCCVLYEQGCRVQRRRSPVSDHRRHDHHLPDGADLAPARCLAQLCSRTANSTSPPRRLLGAPHVVFFFFFLHKAVCNLLIKNTIDQKKSEVTPSVGACRSTWSPRPARISPRSRSAPRTAPTPSPQPSPCRRAPPRSPPRTSGSATTTSRSTTRQVHSTQLHSSSL